jgi:peptidoglycan glycosyltransferase
LSDVLALDGIDVAGRAGPAESGQPGAPAHAWFIGYAPAVQPRYAVAVVIEYGEQGWEVAAPVAVQVLAQAMQTLRVSETLRVSPAG